MKFSDCLKIAFLNVKSYIKTSLLIFMGIFLSLCMIISACSYSSSVKNSMSSVINEYSSESFSSVYDDIENDKKLHDIIENCEDINEIVKEKIFYFVTELLENSYESDGSPSSIENSILVLDSKEYAGINDYSYNFYEDNLFLSKSQKSVPLSIRSVDIGKDYVQFSSNEKEEYAQKHSGSFLIGSELKNSNDIIMSEYILSKYGISDEQIPGLIGKTISLKYNFNDETEYIFKDYVLCGILKTDFYDIHRVKTSPHIIVSMYGNEDKGDNPAYVLFSENFVKAKSVTEYFKSNHVYHVPSGKVWVYSEIEMQKKLYDKLVVLIILLIVVSIFIFIFSSINYYFGKRIKFIVLERSIGMHRFNIFLIFILELLISAMTAFILSVPVSYFLTNVISNIVGGAFGGSVEISAFDFILGLIYGFLFVFTEMLFISVIQILRLKKYKIQELSSE